MSTETFNIEMKNVECVKYATYECFSACKVCKLQCVMYEATAAELHNETVTRYQTPVETNMDPQCLTASSLKSRFHSLVC